MESVESTITRHKKELKVLDGETRAAIKKAKGVKGQKGKELLTSTEAEYAKKLLDLLDKHKAELADKTALDAGMEPIQTDIDVVTPEVEHQQHQQELQQPPPPPSEKEKKLEKAKRKKEKQKEKERLVQEELAEMDANAGPSMRQLELELLDAQLLPLALKISEIQSDGNCLYRAVAAQCGMDYIKVRSLCADHLAANPDDFAPFCEFSDTITTFDQYVDRVRSSNEWGGHLELRALSEGLNKCIVVYSANQPVLVLGEEGDAIRLSYHLHYYSLGEHYNQVVPRTTTLDED